MAVGGRTGPHVDGPTAAPVEVRVRDATTPRGELPLRLVGQAASGPAREGLGFVPRNMNDRAVGVHRTPLVVVADLKVPRTVASPVERHVGLGGLAPGIALRRPWLFAFVAAVFHEGGELCLGDGCSRDGVGANADFMGPFLVVKAEAALRFGAHAECCLGDVHIPGCVTFHLHDGRVDVKGRGRIAERLSRVGQ